MTGQAVSRDSLLTLLEAARWAPSGGNGQPWRFVYAIRDTPAFDRLFGALVPANQEWCVRAGALVLLAAKVVRDDGRPATSASFDAGAAWMAFALQATILGLATHAMAGFDKEKARTAAALPDGVEPQVVIAVGHPGRLEALSEKNREREVPTDRLPMEGIAVEGSYRKDG
jgi:nitroreductase